MKNLSLVKAGMIQDLTGEGIEYILSTTGEVIGKLVDGNFIVSAPQISTDEVTLPIAA